MAQGALVADKRTARLLGAWIAIEDEAARDLRPPKERTWARRGRTPVVTVTGKGSGRVLITGLMLCRPCSRHPPRLIWRTRIYRARPKERKGVRAKEFMELLGAAHRRHNAPIILVWDQASTHHARTFRQFATRHAAWLTVHQLPPYAPDLNPVEGLWAHTRRSLANLAPHGLDQLSYLVRSRLRHLQAQPAVLDGFIAETGLALDLDDPSP